MCERSTWREWYLPLPLPVRFRSPPVDNGVYISIPALASMGSGWALLRACLLPHCFRSFTSSWFWSRAQTGKCFVIVVICGYRILLPPLLLLWVQVRRGLAPPTHSGALGAFGYLVSFPPLPIAPEGRLTKRSACTLMLGRHVAPLLEVHGVAYGVRIWAYEVVGGEVRCKWACRGAGRAGGADVSSKGVHVVW